VSTRPTAPATKRWGQHLKHSNNWLGPGAGDVTKRLLQHASPPRVACGRFGWAQGHVPAAAPFIAGRDRDRHHPAAGQPAADPPSAVSRFANLRYGGVYPRTTHRDRRRHTNAATPHRPLPSLVSVYCTACVEHDVDHSLTVRGSFRHTALRRRSVRRRKGNPSVHLQDPSTGPDGCLGPPPAVGTRVPG